MPAWTEGITGTAGLKSLRRAGLEGRHVLRVLLVAERQRQDEGLGRGRQHRTLLSRSSLPAFSEREGMCPKSQLWADSGLVSAVVPALPPRDAVTVLTARTPAGAGGDGSRSQGFLFGDQHDACRWDGSRTPRPCHPGRPRRCSCPSARTPPSSLLPRSDQRNQQRHVQPSQNAVPPRQRGTCRRSPGAAAVKGQTERGAAQTRRHKKKTRDVKENPTKVIDRKRFSI